MTIRRARPADAVAIGAVHVAAWRSAYPGILPDAYLARLSVPRQAAHYDATIRAGGSVFVATASGADASGGAAPRIVGFATGGRARPTDANLRGLAEGEIETLYVLDDFRERGLGRRLLRATAVSLAEAGLKSLLVWVLRDNPNRWFYAHLGARPVAEATIRVGGSPVVQTAFVWNPIDRLIAASPAGGRSAP